MLKLFPLTKRMLTDTDNELTTLFSPPPQSQELAIKPLSGSVNFAMSRKYVTERKSHLLTVEHAHTGAQQNKAVTLALEEIQKLLTAKTLQVMGVESTFTTPPYSQDTITLEDIQKIITQFYELEKDPNLNKVRDTLLLKSYTTGLTLTSENQPVVKLKGGIA